MRPSLAVALFLETCPVERLGKEPTRVMFCNAGRRSAWASLQAPQTYEPVLNGLLLGFLSSPNHLRIFAARLRMTCIGASLVCALGLPLGWITGRA